MSGYLDRLAVELREAAEREQAKASPRRRRPGFPRMLPRVAVAVACAAAAVAIAITVAPSTEREREIPPAAMSPLARIAGTYQASTPDTLQLLIDDDSLRLVDLSPRHEDNALLGFAKLYRDRLTLRVDARAGSGSFNLGCYGEKPAETGVYRTYVTDQTLRFAVIDEHCDQRARFLTERSWRRVTP